MPPPRCSLTLRIVRPKGISRAIDREHQRSQALTSKANSLLTLHRLDRLLRHLGSRLNLRWSYQCYALMKSSFLTATRPSAYGIPHLNIHHWQLHLTSRSHRQGAFRYDRQETRGHELAEYRPIKYRNLLELAHHRHHLSPFLQYVNQSRWY